MNILKAVSCLTWILLFCMKTLSAQSVMPPVGQEDISELEDIRLTAASAVPTMPSSFVGIPPCRIVDTRGNGFSGPYGPPALGSGIPRDFVLTGRCGIPASAQAVSLNVTVVFPSNDGHLTIFPKGGSIPTVSTLNFRAGQAIANAALVPLGDDGGVTVYSVGSGTNLLVDVNGYFIDPPGAASFKIFATSNIQCAEVMARLNAFTGNTSGFSDIGSSNAYVANDGSWFYHSIAGDCGPMTNIPGRAYALVPVNSQGTIIRGYWKLEALP